MFAVNATPDAIEAELQHWIDEEESLPRALQDMLDAFRAHREFWLGEAEITSGAESIAHNQRARLTFEQLNGAANRYRELRATEFLRRVAAEGNGVCTGTRIVVPASALNLTWVEELVWSEDAGDDYNEWWSQRVRLIHNVCPDCRDELASNHQVRAMSVYGSEDDKVFLRDPVVHDAKFDGEHLLIKGLRFEVEAEKPHEENKFRFPGTRRPRIRMVPTGTDEWFEWKDGAYTEYTDQRKPEYSWWLSDELAAQVGLAPTFIVFAPPQDYMVELGKLRATIKV